MPGKSGEGLLDVPDLGLPAGAVRLVVAGEVALERLEEADHLLAADLHGPSDGRERVAVGGAGGDEVAPSYHQSGRLGPQQALAAAENHQVRPLPAEPCQRRHRRALGGGVDHERHSRLPRQGDEILDPQGPGLLEPVGHAEDRCGVAADRVPHRRERRHPVVVDHHHQGGPLPGGSPGRSRCGAAAG